MLTSPPKSQVLPDFQVFLLRPAKQKKFVVFIRGARRRNVKWEKSGWFVGWDSPVIFLIKKWGGDSHSTLHLI